MNIAKLTLSWAIAVATLASLPAQDPPRPQISTEQRFKQWDKNADGKLTADEVPGPQLFKMLDKNGDGAVTLEEASGFGGMRPGQRQLGPGPGASQGAPLPPAENFQPRPHGDVAAKAGLKPEVLAGIDVEMQRHVAAGNVSGVVALIHHNGARGYFEAFGWQDIEAQKPMPKDAIFRLQSMSKPVVTAGALTLLDEGRFTLDEPISTHLPEWKEPSVQENGQLVPARNPITPRMLMSHSSGLYYGSIEGGPFTGGATGRGARTTLEEHSKSLAAQPLKFYPGEGYSYGTSIDVLGRYIEAVSGQPLDEFLKERLFKPLKMADTDFWVAPEKASRIAQLYSQPKPGELRLGREALQLTTKPTMFLGGQGLCSTAEDYERFCCMLLNRGELDGARVLKPETVDLMFQDHLAVNAAKLGQSGPGQKYGLGGAVDGEGGYLWGGANGTQFWIQSKERFFAIFMVQTQRYKAPAYPAFRALASEAAGLAGGPAGLPGEGGPAGGPGISALFRQRDANGDGKLGRDEVPAVLFDRLDADKDGFVTEEEAKELGRAKPRESEAK